MIHPVEEQTVYEIGYLLSPLLPEAEVFNRAETLIKGRIIEAGGGVISTIEPKFIPLAYAIAKVTDNKKSIFNDAYFGSVKFEIAPEGVPLLHRGWREATEMIRYLLIRTTREEIVIPLVSEENTPVSKVVNLPAEEKKADLDEVIDREIAGMLTT